ncbi:TatD family hydrolase, partial [Salmonella enterica subsp. enterica serovar Kentucky]|nr:TatD family hydrolase [Salmonella enterica subsp. enterica serovar Kentucky]
NAGQVIEVRLPDIEGKDIRNLGDSPQNSHVTTQVNFTCSNVAVEELRLLAAEDDVVAMGETGLDYFYTPETKIRQQVSFIHHIQ